MAIFPKGSSKGSPSKAPQPTDPALNSYVQYEDNATVVLGVVTSIKKDKLLVFNVRGREIELGRGRLYLLPAKEASSGPSQAARVDALIKLEEKIEHTAAEINVPELWSFVQEEQRVFQPADLSTSYFGSDSLERHAALRVALIRERMHFKRDKDGFEPRTPETVEDLLRGEAVKQKKAAVREATLDFFKKKAANPEAPVPRELEENLKLIAEVAASVVHTDAARQKEGKDLVHLCVVGLGLPEAMPIEKQAFEVLVRVGYFHKDSNLSFVRHDIPVEHPRAACEEAAAIQVPADLSHFPEEERAIRIDLTGKETFTIDDESTKDMDDALSVEQTVDGFELGIHITDVAWAVLPETDLDLSARRRATSLYAADQTVNMFPELLSEEKLSLRQGIVRPCISVLVSFDREYRVLKSQVVPTFIKIARRLSYDEVDRLLEAGDSTLLTINDIAAACEENRLRNGAVKVHKREVVPFLEDDGSIRLLEIDEDSHSRALVAEMMVLANSVMADFATKHGIPVLYRGQERPEEEQAAANNEATPEGPAKDFSARTKLKKSTIGLEPQFHSGLGLPAYIQATSPIRRYMDLCHQRQFLSYFKFQKPWIPADEFERLAHEVDSHLQPANLASRETKRFWLFRYLEQRGRKMPIEGTVVRLDLKTPLVELDEVYVTIFVRLNKPAKLGERVTLRVSAVDPHADYIRLEQI